MRLAATFELDLATALPAGSGTRMLNLRCLGALAVEGKDDLGASAGQLRRLALLAVLAAEPHRAVSRDRLLSLLWPESGESRARQSLSQAIYALRRDLGEPDLIVGQRDLRLNPDRITSDVGRLHSAMAAGDPLRAVGEYGGPFLGGVHVSAGIDFERWVDAERARCLSLYCAALERLVTMSRAAADRDATLHWLRRLSLVDPISTRIAVRLADAYVEAGDRGAALRYLREHEARVREEFDVALDPQLVRVRRALEVDDASVGPLRTTPAPPASRDDKHGPEPLPSSGAGSDGTPAEEPGGLVASPGPSDHGAIDGGHGTSDARVGSRSTLTWSRHAVRRPHLAFLVAALAVGVVTFLSRGRAYAEPSRPAAVDTRVRLVMLPFGYSGPPAEAFRAKAIEQLLSAGLSAVPSLQIETQGVTGPVAPRDAGTGVVVTGTVVAGTDSGRVSVVLELRSDAPREEFRLTASDARGDVWRLSDDLARGLIGRLGLRTGRDALVPVASTSTRSLTALRAFVAGEDQFVRGQWVEAQESFTNAIRHDPAFALAHYRLSEAANWNGDVTTQLAAANEAWSLRTSLPVRERLLVEANYAWHAGDIDRAEAGYRDAAARFPWDAEAWYQLGEVRFHSGPVVGRPMERSVDAYRRVAARTEPRVAGRRWEALLHLVRVAGAVGDTVGFDTLAAIAGPLLPESEREELTTLVSCVHRAPAGRVRLRASVDAARTLALLVNAQRCAVYGSSIPDAIALYSDLRASVVDSTSRLAGLIEEAALRAASGDGSGALRTLGPAVAGGYAPALLLHRGLLAWSDPASTPPYLRALRDSLEDGHPRRAPGGLTAVDASFGLVAPPFAPWVAGLLSARLRDDDRTTAAAERLRGVRDTTPVRRAAENLAFSLLAYRDLMQGRPASALVHLDSVGNVAVIPRLEYVVYRAPERLIRAQALAALGRWDEAAAVAQTIGQRSPYEFTYAPAAASVACRAMRRAGRTAAAAAFVKVQDWRGTRGIDCGTT